MRGMCPCGRASTSSWRRPPGAKVGEVAPRLGVGEPATGRRRGRRAAAARQPVRGGRLGVAAAEERPLGRPVARRLHRTPWAAAARDAIHRDGACSAGRASGSDGATASDLPSVAGTWSFTTEAAGPAHRLAFAARPGRRARPLARPVLLGRLQRHLLLAGGELRTDVRADDRGPQAAPARLELSARLLADRHRIPPAVVVPREPTAQHRPRARDAPDRRDRAARGERRAPRRGLLRP